MEPMEVFAYVECFTQCVFTGKTQAATVQWFHKMYLSTNVRVHRHTTAQIQQLTQSDTPGNA